MICAQRYNAASGLVLGIIHILRKTKRGEGGVRGGGFAIYTLGIFTLSENGLGTGGRGSRMAAN